MQEPKQGEGSSRETTVGGVDPPGSVEINSKPAKPAWKKPMNGAGKVPAAEPVMGAVSWPALEDARATKTSDAAKASAAPPPAIEVFPIQGSGTRSALPRGSGNSEVGMKAALSSGASSDHSRPFHQRVEGGGPFTNTSVVNRRSNLREQQGRGSHVWHPHNRGYINGRDSGMAIQHQRVGPRNLPRPGPAFIAANAGFINPAGFHAGGMYFMPAPDTLHGGAYFPPPGPPVLISGPDPVSLRAMLVKQIEYYFSIENLCRDIYLRSNMDAQGFVPVSVIANFNRVRALTPSPALILDSLRNSTAVEVQGDKLRKRDDWANWLLPPSHYATSLSTPLPAAKRESNKASGQFRMVDMKQGVVRADQKKMDDNNHGHSRGASVSGSGVGSETQPSIESCEGFNCMNASAQPVQDELPTVEIGFQVSEQMGVNNSAQVADAINHGTIISNVEVHTEWNSFSFQTEGGVMTGQGTGNNRLTPSRESSLNPARASDVSSECRTTEQKTGGLSAAFEGRNSAHPTVEDTFQLDEELETEHSVCQDPSSQYKSHNNEDEDDSEINDREVERLIIVTQEWIVNDSRRGNMENKRQSGRERTV